MWVIGVKGGVGSGKSRMMEYLRDEFGAEIILADEVAHELMEPGQEGYDRVVRAFGTGVLQKDGRINRAALAGVIFRDPKAREQVDAMIHPLVWAEIRARIERLRAEPAEKIVAVEAALVDEKEKNLYDEIWYADVSEETRIKRLEQSRGYSRQRTRDMMDSQLPPETYRRLGTRVIDNNGTFEETCRQIREIVRNKMR